MRVPRIKNSNAVCHYIINAGRCLAVYLATFLADGSSEARHLYCWQLATMNLATLVVGRWQLRTRPSNCWQRGAVYTVQYQALSSLADGNSVTWPLFLLADSSSVPLFLLADGSSVPPALIGDRWQQRTLPLLLIHNVV
jgi:hypothetical protein